MTKVCPDCGTTVHADAAGCPECGGRWIDGEKFAPPAAQTPVGTASAGPATVGDMSPAQLRSAIMWGTFEGVLLVTAVVFVVQLIISAVAGNGGGSTPVQIVP